jgi:hypothetical protein
MGGKIIAILFLVLVLGGVIYVFRSGVVGKGISELSGAFHASSSSFNLTLAPSSPMPPVSPTFIYQSSTSTISSATPTSTINPADIPAGFTATQLSSYFHAVRFGGMSPASPYSYGSYGQITLYASFAQGAEPIDVTGWKITSNRGGEYLPQAINLYDPSGLTPPGDIMFASGQSLYIYSSPGPFNVRLNECIGYIAAQNKFTPALPQTCPYVDRSGISSFTGACQNFIQTIGNCQVPDLNNPQIPSNDYACRDYIKDNFNYRACYNAHVADANFLSNQWWIWMGSSPLDPYHDNVYLYDRNGLLVDMYTY